MAMRKDSASEKKIPEETEENEIEIEPENSVKNDDDSTEEKKEAESDGSENDYIELKEVSGEEKNELAVNNDAKSVNISSKNENEFEESAHMTSERIRKWFDNQGWKGNPFVLNIIPSVFVGYELQKHKLIACVEQKHKVCLIVGATGSGKTTAMRWLAENFGKEKGFRAIFISKPPATTEEFVEIFNRELFSVPWYLMLFRPLMPHIKNINSVSQTLNQRFRNEHLVILCDEIHEADMLVLQWLRVIADQVENLSLVISGLPISEEKISSQVETFQKRITEKVSLTSLTKEETRDLIEGRIRYMAKDANPKNPFTADTIEFIYKETGGFPREILRICDKAVNEAIRKGLDTIEPSLFAETKIEEKQQAVTFDLRSMPRRQREIIEAIRTGKNTPGEIIDSIDLEKYKSKSHAIRSVNNILQRMMKDGIIEREKQGKTFIYTLSPRIKSIAVQA
jgi:type II secretory pathway predicted ATPase ExeA